MPLFLPPVEFQSTAAAHAPAQIQHLSYHDVQWNRPLFRPPSLQAKTQIWNDIPFSAQTCPKVARKK